MKRCFGRICYKKNITKYIPSEKNLDHFLPQIWTHCALYEKLIQNLNFQAELQRDSLCCCLFATLFDYVTGTYH